MVKTDMIIHGVLYKLHSTTMEFGTELFIQITCTQTTVDFVMIGDGIAVFSAARHIVFYNWCQPQCCHAKVLKVIEVIDDSLNIATMTIIQRVAIQRLILQLFYFVVGWVSVAETIRHDE